MNQRDWAKIQHFAPSEFSEPELMDRDFLIRLDAFRAAMDEPVHINFSNGAEKHAPDSLHYHGKAVDLILARPVTLDDFITATRYFSEVGFYPEWANQKVPAARGGLHVGFNWTADRTVMQRKYWLGIKGSNGANDYLPLTVGRVLKTST